MAKPKKAYLAWRLATYGMIGNVKHKLENKEQGILDGKKVKLQDVLIFY